MSNATSDETAFQAPSRRSLAPIYILSVLGCGFALASLLAVTDGLIDPLGWLVDGPTVKDYLTFDTRESNTFNWSDQTIENWNFEQYNLSTGQLDWVATGKRAAPVNDPPGHVFVFKGIRVEFRDTNKKDKDSSTIYTMISDDGRARFQSGKSVEVDLGDKDSPVFIDSEGLKLRLPQSHIFIPAQVKNPKAVKKKNLAKQAQENKFSIESMEMTAPGPANIELNPSSLNRDKTPERATSAVMKILSEQGLMLKGRRELTLKGPVTLEIPPEYFKDPDKKASKAKDEDTKKKKSARSSDFLRSWFPSGALIESEELQVQFLLPDGAEKNIQGFHLKARGKVRMRDLATKELRGRCETLEIILLANHWSGELARGMGSLGGASLMSLETLKSPTLAYFRAEKEVEFKGLVKNDPKKEARFVQLTAEFLEREFDEGELKVRGLPARFIEKNLKGELQRRLEAKTLHMSEEGPLRRIRAEKDFFAHLFLKSSEIKLKGDKAALTVEEVPAPKSERSGSKDSQKKDKASQEIKEFRLSGAPAVVEEIRKRRTRQLKALDIAFQAEDATLLAEGEVFGDFRRISKESTTRNELKADQLKMTFEDNPFKGLKLDDALDKDGKEKKDKKEKTKKKEQKLDLGGQIQSLTLRAEDSAVIQQTEGKESRLLKAKEIRFTALQNQFDLEGGVVSTWKNPEKKLQGRLSGDKAALFFSKNPFKDQAKKKIEKTGDPLKDKALKEKAKKDQQNKTLESLERVTLTGRPAKIEIDREKEKQSFEAEDILFVKKSRALQLRKKFRAALRKGEGEKLEVTELKGERAEFRVKKNPFAMVEGLGKSEKGEGKKDKEKSKGKQFDLSEFDSVQVEGPKAEIYTKQDPKEPSMRMKARAFRWDSESQKIEAVPAPGERITIGRDDGLELEADTVQWIHEERILVLTAKNNQGKLVLLKDKEGSAGQAELIVMHWPESKTLNELELSRGPEIILDLVGRVRLKTKSDGAFLSSKSKKKKEKEKKKDSKKTKKSKQRSIPLLLQCDSARVFLVQQSDPDLSGYDLSMAIMQGKDNENVSVRGSGKEERDRFLLEAPAIRLFGDNNEKTILCSTRPRQRPRLTTDAGDRLTSEQLTMFLKKIPASAKKSEGSKKKEDSWVVTLKLLGKARGRFTSITSEKDKVTKKKTYYRVLNDLSADRLSATLNLGQLKQRKEGEEWRALLKLDADGKVEVKNRDSHVFGDVLTYDAEDQIMEMRGKPVKVFFDQGKSSVELPRYRFAEFGNLKLPPRKKKPKGEAKRKQ